jgi:hypothetical protein
MHDLQHADMMMMAAELTAGPSAAGMQPLPAPDALLEVDMDADSTDYAALLDEIFTDSVPAPAAYGTANMQQQAPLPLNTSTAGLPGAAAGHASSSGTAVQQQCQLLLGTSVGSPVDPAAAGPSNLQATSLQYEATHRSGPIYLQLPVSFSLRFDFWPDVQHGYTHISMALALLPGQCTGPPPSDFVAGCPHLSLL